MSAMAWEAEEISSFQSSEHRVQSTERKARSAISGQRSEKQRPGKKEKAALGAASCSTISSSAELFALLSSEYLVERFNPPNISAGFGGESEWNEQELLRCGRWMLDSFLSGRGCGSGRADQVGNSYSSCSGDSDEAVHPADASGSIGVLVRTWGAGKNN
ncbi:MAG TPA: hypothetical protein VME18_01640 [Acidobacteriaceae bacterium]|nr:hypothetical protein [Acidobacteriaceae bacterium]